MKYKKVLVTGGLGFIGSNFIRHLLSKYPSVKIINLDKMTYAGNHDNLRDIEKFENYKFIKGDICNENIVSEIIPKVDIIFNFAAESHVDRSITGPREFIKTDILGTHTLLDYSRKNDIKKFVQISTDEVYGSVPEGSFKENDLLNPSSPYSASKAGAEMIVNSYNTTYGLPIIITRSSNNFGPYQYPEKIIPLFITNLLEEKKVPIYGDGTNVRDWIYVIDNCEAIDFASNKGKAGEVYNVGGGNEIKNIEITKKILKHLNKDNYFIEFVKDRLGHDLRYSLDCKKIKKLGWQPRFEFEEALIKTIEWYKNNQDWWKKIKKKEELKV